MNPTFWAAGSAVASAVGLGVALVFHIIRYAYQQGASDQRIDEVERRVAETTQVGPAIAGLQATVSELAKSVERLDRVTERLEERTHRTRAVKPTPA